MMYDNAFGIMDDLFPEEETKKEGPQKEEPSRNQLRLHYTQIPAKGQVPRGLYLVGRTAASPAVGR